MEHEFYRITWFALNDESINSRPDSEEVLDDEEEEEDENVRGFTETVKERCPKCFSSFLEKVGPYVTKDGLLVLRCKGCRSLLCPRCTSLLFESYADDGRKVLRCPKCGILS